MTARGVKTTEGGERGHDVFKVVTGRKRHVIVNTLGPPLAVVGTAADIRDRDGAKLVLAEVGTRSPRLG